MPSLSLTCLTSHAKIGKRFSLAGSLEAASRSSREHSRTILQINALVETAKESHLAAVAFTSHELLLNRGSLGGSRKVYTRSCTDKN